ncbi:MAG TPA: NADH-quinone oxidoreductase subunit NuoH [Candidatus Paceibacterota bacterium]|nr:NADH-quinone oxidoreductase subunit NuoH [Candidatus Paceibacterota bacterium]
MFEWMNQLTEAQSLVVFSLVKIGVVLATVMLMISYAVVAERRICAFIQDRIGPNRVGPWGLLQPFADGLKSFLKEDFVPGHVRKVYFWLAPAAAMLPGLLTVAVIPFGSNLGGQKMVIADLNVGILYTFGIVSLGVYGIVLAGYAANSKYPFLGGIRSSAQMISYEVAMGLSVIPVFMLAGDLNLSRVIELQTGGWFGWLVFKLPLSFFLFVIAGFAETNRLPFDLPEAENELVGGYNTEYSSIKFALFFMGEYANMIMLSAMTVTLFLGGWTLPFAGLDRPATTLTVGLLHIGIFLAKVIALVCFMIWVRWMLPRFRFDQLMDLGWRRMIPVGLANIVIYAVILWMRA